MERERERVGGVAVVVDRVEREDRSVDMVEAWDKRE